MRKLVCFFLLSLFVFGCTGKPEPMQVQGELKFGPYVISPPNGYWYFPRKYPNMFKSSKDYFVVTFWENKEDTSKKSYPKKSIGVCFNFFVAANKYKNIDDYYNDARKFGVTYKRLPNEAEVLKSMANWSCKQTGQGMYGIECISLRDNFIAICEYGDDKNKSAVLSKIQLLQKMLMIH
jgi:hypothetical protein